MSKLRQENLLREMWRNDSPYFFLYVLEVRFYVWAKLFEGIRLTERFMVANRIFS